MAERNIESVHDEKVISKDREIEVLLVILRKFLTKNLRTKNCDAKTVRMEMRLVHNSLRGSFSQKVRKVNLLAERVFCRKRPPQTPIAMVIQERRSLSRLQLYNNARIFPEFDTDSLDTIETLDDDSDLELIYSEFVQKATVEFGGDRGRDSDLDGITWSDLSSASSSRDFSRFSDRTKTNSTDSLTVGVSSPHRDSSLDRALAAELSAKLRSDKALADRYRDTPASDSDDSIDSDKAEARSSDLETIGDLTAVDSRKSLSTHASELETIHTNSTEALTFKIILKEADLESPIVFKPAFTDQIFPRELVLGYFGLKVEVVFLACSLQCHLTYSFDECDEQSELADNIMEKLCTWLTIDFFDQMSEFKLLIPDEHQYEPTGDHIASFHTGNESFDLFICKLDHEHYLPFFERIQSFNVFYMPKAYKVESPDLYFAYTIYKTEKDDHHSFNRFVGYALVNKMDCYIGKFTIRISCVLILPPYQRKGLGKWLLHSIFEFYDDDDSVVDIIIDGNNRALRNIWDIVDVERALGHPSCSQNRVKHGLTNITMFGLQHCLHVAAARVVRVYEMARLYWVKVGDVHDQDPFQQHICERVRAMIQGGFYTEYLAELELDSMIAETTQYEPEILLELTYFQILKTYEPIVDHIIMSQLANAIQPIRFQDEARGSSVTRPSSRERTPATLDDVARALPSLPDIPLPEFDPASTMKGEPDLSD